nr:hypothetical protein [Mesorhizobium sp. CA16]
MRRPFEVSPEAGFVCLWRKADSQVKPAGVSSACISVGKLADCLFQKAFYLITPDENRSRLVCWLFLFPPQALALRDISMTVA